MIAPADFNPFVGLRPFEREDSLCYFGRGEQVQALLELLVHERFLAVVGSSGCGKSSLIRAGLIPALEGGFLVQDRDRWCIAAMKPGEAPLRHLASALLDLAAGGPGSDDAAARHPTEKEEPGRFPTRDLAVRLYDEGTEAALEMLEAVDGTGQINLLLLVDQFEELFRFGLSREDPKARDEAETFVALLLRLAEQSRLPVYVCITMRSDFLGDCDAFIRLPEAINAGQFLVPRLTRIQRREAIEGPVRLGGRKIAPRLVDRLLNENLETRDDLPILQHLLMRVWDTWSAEPDAGPIDLAHYEGVHGIHRALDQHAEEALHELSPTDRVVARVLFQTCTELDPGNRRIRRPVHLSEVTAIAGAPAERVMGAIERFRVEGRNFLVLSSANPADDPLIDISHESLIRQWATLRDWVDEEAAAAKLYRRLAETAELHAEAKAGLYREADLEQALDWQRRSHPNPAWAERYPGDFGQAVAFLRQSRLARCNEKREKKRARVERERLLKEKADLAEQKAEQERTSRKKYRRWAAGMAALAVLMLILAGVSGFFWVEAERQTARAQTQLLAANFNRAKAHEEKAVGILNEPERSRSTRDYQRALLQALHAQRQEIGGKPALRLAARNRLGSGALQRAFAERWASPALNLGSSVTSVAFSGDGRLLASASDDNTVRLWDPATGALRPTLEGHWDNVNSVAFSGDGRLLASASDDNTVRLWDPATGALRPTLEGHGDRVTSVAFSGDGRLLASASDDNTVRLWDPATGALKRTLEGHGDRVTSVAFSGDGRLLASASYDNTVRLWDPATGALRPTLEGHGDRVTSVAFSGDGTLLASASGDKTVRLWDPATGALRRTLEGHGSLVTAVAFSGDGTLLASASGDKMVRLWDPATGELRRTLEGHGAEVYSVAFSGDGTLLASASDDNTVRLWDPATGALRPTLEGHWDNVYSVAFSGDGTLLASASGDKTVRLWDPATGALLRTLEGHGGQVFSVAFSGDGTLLASASGAGNTVRLWDPATGALKRTLEGHGSGVSSVAFSGDGTLLASASGDKTVRLWDPATGALKRTLEGHGDRVTSVAFSGDGSLLASASEDNTVRLWDPRTLFLLRNGPAPSSRAALISEALQRLWGLRVDGLDIVPESWHWPLPRNGYYVDQEIRIPVGSAVGTADGPAEPEMRTFNIRPLLDPPRPGEDKFYQLIRWLEEQEL